MRWKRIRMKAMDLALTCHLVIAMVCVCKNAFVAVRIMFEGELEVELSPSIQDTESVIATQPNEPLQGNE